MKINFILMEDNLAGGTKSNRLIGEALIRRGHDVVMYYCCAPPKAPPIYRVRTYLRWLLRRVRGLFQKRKGHLISGSVPLVPIAARNIVSSQVRDADVVIATWWETAEWIANWPASKGLKAYFIRHYEIWGGDTQRVDATYRLPMQKLVIASWLKKLMSEKFGDEFAALIPNGIDWRQFHASPRDRNPTPRIGFQYGNAGWKGADTILNAIRILQMEFPELEVVCFGSESIVHDVSGIRSLEFRLRPPQKEIASIYASTDCWVLPSTSEGFGMPGIEAAACHCPVVSTRCGGPEDYVQDGVNGFLVPVGDPQEMALAVSKVLRQSSADWKRMSEASHEISKKFNWDRSAETLEKVLTKSDVV